MAYVVLLSEQSKVEIAAIKKSGDKATIKKFPTYSLSFRNIRVQVQVKWSI